MGESQTDLVVNAFLLYFQAVRVLWELTLRTSVRWLHYWMEGESPGLRSPLMHILFKMITSSPGGLKYGSWFVSSAQPNWKHMGSCKHKAGNVWLGPLFDPYSIWCYRRFVSLSLNNEVEVVGNTPPLHFFLNNNTKQTGFIHDLGICKNIQWTLNLQYFTFCTQELLFLHSPFLTDTNKQFRAAG